MALALVRSHNAWPKDLATAILEAQARVKLCPRCGFYAEGEELCDICRDTSRDSTTLCVVETANDVLPIERAGIYRGLYHCLGGKISPLDGIGPEHLRIGSLLERVESGVGEVIVALGNDVEGETTSIFLSGHLPTHLRISRLAQGLPMGGSIEIADSLTLGKAMENRLSLR